MTFNYAVRSSDKAALNNTTAEKQSGNYVEERDHSLAWLTDVTLQSYKKTSGISRSIIFSQRQIFS
jgi:hypothetical protein